MKKGKNRKIRLEQVWEMENLRLADRIARRGKSTHYGVRKFDADNEGNLLRLQESIRNRTFRTSAPTIERRYCEGKWRTLAKVKYYDHVAHHALMNVIMPILERSFYYESAAGVKGRGIHYAAKHVRKCLDMNAEKELWWAQTDFVKFYHNVIRQKMYDRLCKTFGDEGIRWMLHDVIWALGEHNGEKESDGSTGVGIGLYPIQPIVNFYLNDLDRRLSQTEGVKIFRYCDNILFIGDSPKAIWKAIDVLKDYAENELVQPLHNNIGIQKLDDVHPIDFVGYLFYKEYTYIRKSIKYKFKSKVTSNVSPDTMRSILSSYKGWLEHANGLTLWKKVTGMKKFSDLSIKRSDTEIDGKKYFDCPLVPASFLTDRLIVVKDFVDNVETRNGKDRVCVLVEENGKDCKFLTNNPRLKDILRQVKEQEAFPFEATMHKRILSGNKIDYYFE